MTDRECRGWESERGRVEPRDEAASRPVRGERRLGGASRARTGGLQSATLALSQLSYSPELVLRRPVYPTFLVVLGWRKPQIERAALGNHRDRNEVRPSPSLGECNYSRGNSYSIPLFRHSAIHVTSNDPSDSSARLRQLVNRTFHMC